MAFQIFSKEKLEEIKDGIRSINKLHKRDQRIEALQKFREKLQYLINDEIDELLSVVNLKKDKEEEE